MSSESSVECVDSVSHILNTNQYKRIVFCFWFFRIFWFQAFGVKTNSKLFVKLRPQPLEMRRRGGGLTQSDGERLRVDSIDTTAIKTSVIGIDILLDTKGVAMAQEGRGGVRP